MRRIRDRLAFDIPSELWIEYADERSIIDGYWHPTAGQIAIDVGAGWGIYTIPALIDGATVYAVEPHDRTADIERVAEMNGVRDRLVIVRAALWDGAVYPDVLRRCPVPILIPPGDAPLITLDELVAAESIERVDWVKVDVEGAEVDVLRGGVKTLRRDHPTLVLEEHTLVYEHVREARVADQLATLLAELRYRVQRILYRSTIGGAPEREFWICS